MRPADIAHGIATWIATDNPTADARTVNAKTTTFLVEALLYVIQMSTRDEQARAAAIHIAADALRDSAALPPEAHGKRRS